MILRFIFISLLLTTNLFAELYWSGKVNIPYNFYLKNFKNTENPIRFINLNIDYSLDNVDFKSNTAFEYKWNQDEFNPINLREYYLSYYPSFGEISIGKQIITWGVADGNNPTDNINPYDLNYMFSTGVGRKVGIHSISSIFYHNDSKINFIISYDKFKYQFNSEIPFECSIYGANEDDKCNSGPQFDNHIEYGLDFQHNMNNFEFSISYLNGRDRFYNENIQTLGTNFLYMYDEFAFRLENAFYIVNNNEKFAQAIIQIEYPEILTLNIGNQLFGTYDINAQKIYGIGSPIFILSEYMFILSISRMFYDDTIELNSFLLYNLGKGNGYSIGSEITYMLNNNIKTSINISNFFKGSTDNTFTNLEDKSSIKLSVQYFF